MTLRRRIAPISTFTLVLVAAGCSSDKTAKDLAAMNTANIQRVSNLYAGFQNMVSSSGPKDEAEFKNFIKSYDPNRLSAMSVDPNNLDKVFTSERDGKPFKIKWKVGGGRGAVAPVVFEEVGVNGKKQVGFTHGKFEEVDDAQYKALWDGKMMKPPSESADGAGQGAGRPVGGRPAGAPTGPPGG